MADATKYMLQTEDISYICNITSNTFHLPVHFLNQQGNILFQSVDHQGYHPAYADHTEAFQSILDGKLKINVPMIHTNCFYETFICLPIQEETSVSGTFIIGPALLGVISLDTIDDMIAEYKLPIQLKKKIYEYYRRVPVINMTILQNYSLSFYYTIYHKKFEIDQIKEQNHSFQKKDFSIQQELNESISERRMNTMFHTSYKLEQKLLQCIKEGNVEKLLTFMNTPINGTVGILSKANPLRDMQNHFIVACTIAARAAIEAGLDSEYVYSLSDQYIQKGEELKNLYDIGELTQNMFRELAQRVHDHKARPQYHNYINQCLNYISNHLYEDITLLQLSKEVNLNSNYLSEKFAKEVGIPIVQYIQNERIKEAKNLLILSDHTLSEISELLNFGAQSYFSTVFKRVVGISPKKYREMNQIN